MLEKSIPPEKTKTCKASPKEEIPKDSIVAEKKECWKPKTKFEKYLNECENMNPYKIRIWSEIVNTLEEMETVHEQTMNGRYGGGFATFLHTKGKYDTTDIDYKIYPKENANMEEIRKKVETYINSKKKELLSSINGGKNTFTDILTKWSIGQKTTEEDDERLQKMREGVFKISLVGPGYGRNGMFYGKTTIAYCDIGFYSEQDIASDIVDKEHVDGILPKVNAKLYDVLGGIRVIDTGFLIQEKNIFLTQLKNETMEHKRENWAKQVELLKEVKSGGRKKKTRKKKRKYKKRRTKKNKKRTKKKKKRRRKKRKTRRR